MTLQEAIDQYVECKLALGACFDCPARFLRRCGRAAGPEIRCDEVTPGKAGEFLSAGDCGPNTRAWRYSVLGGFYRFAIGRGWAQRSPLPPRAPARVPPAPPYIYTRQEVQCLLDGTKTYTSRVCQLEPHTLRTLILLLYATGLRPGEALRLKRSDLDLAQGLLRVRDAKGGKQRLVALCPALVQALRTYDRHERPHAVDDWEQEAFLLNRDGTPLNRETVRYNFRKLCQSVGIRRGDRARGQPRLHDLRHTFATDRVTAWYREGRDLRRLLPTLSTHLGHVSLSGTQVYLSMTPELLLQASLRFERYAQGGGGLP
ncbi:MAG: tyrosine-type recombinase/integrase [Bryobacterales bacterium]|nr:tyrosine-type recombinase/integrase [Bryobacterales bacterium]